MRAGGSSGQRTMCLTTRGRRSGQPRTVTIWFVDSGPRSVFVQHAAGTPPQWYRNLLADPAVQVDLGDGPQAARAVPITEPTRVKQVLAMIRRKYWAAWLIQLIGWRSKAVAAEITWWEPGG